MASNQGPQQPREQEDPLAIAKQAEQDLNSLEAKQGKSHGGSDSSMSFSYLSSAVLNYFFSIPNLRGSSGLPVCSARGMNGALRGEIGQPLYLPFSF